MTGAGHEAEIDLTSDEALGLRVADCGCCYVVDKVALDALGAAYVGLARTVYRPGTPTSPQPQH